MAAPSYGGPSPAIKHRAVNLIIITGIHAITASPSCTAQALYAYFYWSIHSDSKLVVNIFSMTLNFWKIYNRSRRCQSAKLSWQFSISF